MIYTIQIKDNSKKAKSIINMLKALKDDYNFIEISENINSKLDAELENVTNCFQKIQKGKIGIH